MSQKYSGKKLEFGYFFLDGECALAQREQAVSGSGLSLSSFRVVWFYQALP
jgi:hypothetical protein